VDSTADYLIEQINTGAEAVQLFDSWAGLLSETQFHRLVIEPTREIVRRIREVHPETPIIGFPKGSGALTETFVAETGVDGVSIDAGVPLAFAAERLQPKTAVQGNLDNQVLVTGGNALEAEANRILDALIGGPFIFNLGHGVLPQTPPENVARVAELIRERG